MNLKEFQDRFQRAILNGDDAILRDIPDGPHETKAKLLGIYRDAYTLRLIEVLGNDHEMLRAYMEADEFGAMARAYIASCPSQHSNARWFSMRLPEFLRASEPFATQPVLGDLADLERALNDAFDGPDAPVLGLADLATVPPATWGALSFVCHPTAACIDLRTNAAEIWSALKSETDPPPCTVSPAPKRILVWRHDTTSRFREIENEEAMIWAETAKGTSFGDLCELLAIYDDPPSAPARAAAFLKCWLEAGLLSEVTLPR